MRVNFPTLVGSCDWEVCACSGWLVCEQITGCEPVGGPKKIGGSLRRRWGWDLVTAGETAQMGAGGLRRCLAGRMRGQGCDLVIAGENAVAGI